ncbi:hypothetical protein SHKM778_69000 [Streptomyces sp. KM77-8]|uniref:Uncharacterized protein n=1 Tax=Streptomyces haneummycinicus TaxID=3074435 RepID=A0AAT9HSQ1_9ACTN
MRTEEFGEEFRLGLAQLRKLFGGVGHRAVVLAELLTDRRVTRRRSVPVGTEGLGQRFGPVLGGRGLDRLAVRVRVGGDPGAGEGRDRVLAAPCSPIHRRASTASLSYDWSKASRPQSVRANTLAGRPRVRAP